MQEGRTIDVPVLGKVHAAEGENMKAIISLASALIVLFANVGASGGFAQESRRQRPFYGGFGVEVLVDNWPLERLYGRGRTYVEAVQGAEYELRIRNPFPYRIAVALSVDGLNTIDARRTSSREASKWVIEPYGTIRVGGWQMSTDRARRFYFTSERDSYAARLGRASDLGLITAVFYREAAPVVTRERPRPYPNVDDAPARSEGQSGESARAPQSSANGERKSQRGTVTTEPSGRDDEYAATGIGRSVHNRVYRVDMQLERQPAAEITIRYEYRPALIQLGILPRNPPYIDPLRRRERARGFEDFEFSPEP